MPSSENTLKGGSFGVGLGAGSEVDGGVGVGVGAGVVYRELVAEDMTEAERRGCHVTHVDGVHVTSREKFGVHLGFSA